MSTVTAFARYRRGAVGETRRSVHLVPLPTDTFALGDVPQRLTALCGEAFLAGQGERLDRLAGMPCETCLVRVRASEGRGELA
nr:hypothetical protein [Prauserella shujinwangii]